MRSTVMAVVFTCSLFACKGKEDKGSQPATSAPSGAPGSGAPGSAAPAAPATPQVGINVCGFATKEQVEGAIGKLTADPKPQPTQGSLLAGCEYTFEGGTAMVTIHPANEFDVTVKVSDDATEVPNLGEKTLASKKTGLYVKVGGKRYFFHIVAAGANGLDNDKALALAKVVVPGSN